MTAAAPTDRRELLILRHAKSAWDTDAPADFDRPLAPRGCDAASRMGRYLAEAGLPPDAVVCSSATRAVQTVHRVARAGGFSLRTARFEGAIYEAGLPALLGVLGGCLPGARRTMIVGHNPGLEDLLHHLAGGGFSLRTARFEGAIYEAGLPALLGVLGGCLPGARRTMIVGHNPGLEDLLHHLAGGVPVPADGKLLPTAALARLTLPDDWRRLDWGCGELISFTRVRDLVD